MAVFRLSQKSAIENALSQQCFELQEKLLFTSNADETAADLCNAERCHLLSVFLSVFVLSASDAWVCSSGCLCEYVVLERQCRKRERDREIDRQRD